MPLRYPDEPLNKVQMTLSDFVSRAQVMLEQDPDEFVRFVLAGRFSAEAGHGTRAYINICQGSVHLSDADVTVVRDFDSAIGITKDLPFKHAVAVYPIAPFRETLTRNNHLSRAVTKRDVSCVFMSYGLVTI